MTDSVRPGPAWADRFIEALGRSGNARQAAREAGTNYNSPHYRRRTNPRFAEQWGEALARAKAAREAPRQPEAPVSGPPARNWRDVFFAELAAS